MVRKVTRTPPYAAIKATLMQYTQTQALDFAAKNIRVNCVAPGSIYFKGGTWDDAEQNNSVSADVVDHFSRMLCFNTFR